MAYIDLTNNNLSQRQDTQCFLNVGFINTNNRIYISSNDTSNYFHICVAEKHPSLHVDVFVMISRQYAGITNLNQVITQRPHTANNLTLDLAFNEIQNIYSQAFSCISTPCLYKDIMLPWNCISTISDDAFSGIVIAGTLDLSHNNLTSLPQEVFSEQMYLKM